MSAMLSVITATSPARLSKGFELAADGSLRKLPGGVLVRGKAERLEIASPADLAALLGTLSPSQALAFGVPAHDADVVAQAELDKHPGAISRTRQYFTWPEGGGVLLLDYDPEPGAVPLPFADLLVALVQAMPELATAPMVAIPSASSGIFTTEGAELRGVRGWHLFVFVEKAADIPAIGETLTGRLWLAGHGRIQVSKSGACLERTLADTSVFQPERLSFDGGAACGKGLEQRRGAPIVRNPDAAPMPTPAALNQREQAQAKRLQKEGKEAAKPEIEAAQELWLDERVAEILHREPDRDREEVRQNLVRAVTGHELMGDFILTCQSGEQVTTGEILDSPKKWHAKRFADPLEPTYSGGDRRIAVARLFGNRPMIYSHAHGGQAFRLLRQTRGMLLVDGQYPEHLAEIAGRLGADRALFDFGGALVAVADGRVTPLRAAGVAHLCETRFAFRKFDARERAEKACQLPSELAARMLEARDCWASVPKLVAVVSHPVITPTGEILQRDGFHEGTGLLIASGRDWSIPDSPTREQVQAAIATLWRPLSLMPFESPADAGAALALLLTAVCRPTLALSPMFLTSAPGFAHGKTLVGQTAAILAGGDGAVTTMHTDEAEQQKSLVALLLAGQPACLLDNQGAGSTITGDALAALLTGEVFRSRILGKSEQVALPTRTLLIASGVNIAPAADLVRRTLTIRIDQGTERPEVQRFPFCPVELARETRQAMQAAGALILRAAFNAGAWDVKPERSMGSFGDFDRVVRRSVLWLIAEGLAPCPMADPLDTQAREYESDPTVAQVETLFAAWRSFVGAEPIGAMDILEKANMNSASPDAAAILHVADEVAGMGGGHINPKRWGKYLARHKGRVIAGHRLTQPSTVNGMRRWQVALVAKGAYSPNPVGNVRDFDSNVTYQDKSEDKAHQSTDSHPNAYARAKGGEA